MLIEIGEGCETHMTVIDLLIDEGHRLGAYYLYKSMALTFYVCIPRHHALKVRPWGGLQTAARFRGVGLNPGADSIPTPHA